MWRDAQTCRYLPHVCCQSLTGGTCACHVALSQGDLPCGKSAPGCRACILDDAILREKVALVPGMPRRFVFALATGAQWHPENRETAASFLESMLALDRAGVLEVAFCDLGITHNTLVDTCGDATFGTPVDKKVSELDKSMYFEMCVEPADLYKMRSALHKAFTEFSAKTVTEGLARRGKVQQWRLQVDAAIRSFTGNSSNWSYETCANDPCTSHAVCTTHRPCPCRRRTTDNIYISYLNPFTNLKYQVVFNLDWDVWCVNYINGMIELFFVRAPPARRRPRAILSHHILLCDRATPVRRWETSSSRAPPPCCRT